MSNRKNPAVKRILADVRELQTHPSSRYFAAPLEDNMFEWHFTIRGPADSSFADGIYHGRILLPTDYPFKPPNIVFLTVSSTFCVGIADTIVSTDTSFMKLRRKTADLKLERRSVSAFPPITKKVGNQPGEVCVLVPREGLLFPLNHPLLVLFVSSHPPVSFLSSPSPLLSAHDAGGDHQLHAQ